MYRGTWLHLHPRLWRWKLYRWRVKPKWLINLCNRKSSCKNNRQYQDKQTVPKQCVHGWKEDFGFTPTRIVSTLLPRNTSQIRTNESILTSRSVWTNSFRLPNSGFFKRTSAWSNVSKDSRSPLRNNIPFIPMERVPWHNAPSIIPEPIETDGSSTPIPWDFNSWFWLKYKEKPNKRMRSRKGTEKGARRARFRTSTKSKRLKVDFKKNQPPKQSMRKLVDRIVVPVSNTCRSHGQTTPYRGW